MEKNAQTIGSVSSHPLHTLPYTAYSSRRRHKLLLYTVVCHLGTTSKALSRGAQGTPSVLCYTCKIMWVWQTRKYWGTQNPSTPWFLRLWLTGGSKPILYYRVRSRRVRSRRQYCAYEQSVLTVWVTLLCATTYIHVLRLLPKLFYSRPGGAPAPLPPPSRTASAYFHTSPEPAWLLSSFAFLCVYFGLLACLLSHPLQTASLLCCFLISLLSCSSLGWVLPSLVAAILYLAGLLSCFLPCKRSCNLLH